MILIVENRGWGDLLQCNFVFYKFGVEDWPGIKSGLCGDRLVYKHCVLCLFAE